MAAIRVGLRYPEFARLPIVERARVCCLIEFEEHREWLETMRTNDRKARQA